MPRHAPSSPLFVPPALAWLLGHRARRAQRAAAGLALLVCALAAAAAGWYWAQQRSAVEALLVAADTGPAAPAASTAKPLSAQDSARINRVVRRLNTDWAAIFQALERAARPKEVAIVSLESDAERGAVRVVTEGPALDALLAHAERVQASPRFVRSQLLRIEPPDGASQAELSRLSFDLVLAR
jgi:uncharacterized protein HemX